MAYVNNTGLPSVTEILKPYIDTRWFTQEHADRGTLIHDYCHRYIKGDWYLPPLPVEYQGYFNSFTKWADSTVEAVILSETRLVNRALGYCGQPDFIGRIKGCCGLVLLDWKTSQSYQSWFALQGEAYRELARTDRGIETVKSGSVRLKADGSGCLVDWAPASALNIFFGILNAHHFFKKGI